jgi:hypothetical protein
MQPHDSRDLDDVIDDVARAMTSAGCVRDLRSAVASRIASSPSWIVPWRAGVTAAAIAAVVLAAIVLRPRPAAAPSRPAVAESSSLATARPAAAPLVARRDEAPTPSVILRGRAAVRRQIGGGDPAVHSVVEIEPVAILPLGEDRAPAPAQARIDIAPIDVEPVHIRELDPAGE